MAKEIIKSAHVTKLDILNAEASAGFKALIGQKVTVSGAAIIQDERNDGTVDTYGYLFGENGEVFGGNSDTIKRSIDQLIDLMNEDDGTKYAATVESRPTSSGRDFYTMKVFANA